MRSGTTQTKLYTPGSSRNRPPTTWLWGLIRFLFKKGDLLDAANYRTVCLQDCVCKLVSEIFIGRLYSLAERYGLLDSWTPRKRDSVGCCPYPNLKVPNF
jgi:hypothetical protein